ncbi:MAG: spore germination protein [Bacilli bacterium]
MKNKIDKNIENVQNFFEKYKENCADLNIRLIKIANKKILYIFYESTSSDDKISNFFMKSISDDVKNKHLSMFSNLFKMLENTIPNSKLKQIETYQDVFYHLASGFTCIFVNDVNKAIAIETKNKLDRSINEATTEAIIRGPKDSFTENYMTNIGLIRKRIKDEKLLFTEVKVGRRTQTKVAIIYLNDVVNLDKIKQIEEKLKQINIDGIIDSGYIRELIIKNNKSSFPKMISSERPDVACISLLNGKIVMMIENSPFVLIIPGLFIDFFHSPEDNYQKPINVSFTRILRVIAFMITILTPALYIAAMTYNAEIIPDKLLISLAIQRQGVPFPTYISVILLLITYQILRESDIRMPSLMGSSISIVGALVLGDAAVAAGIVSPIVVITVAITSISGQLFTDIDFVNAIRWWGALFILGAMFLGLIGMVAVGIIFIAKLASLESLGVPYLAPFSPFYLSEQKDGIFRFQRNKLKNRPGYLTDKNQIKLGENNEN